MKSRRVALLQALLVVFLLTFGASRSFGQYTWKKVGTFNTAIGSGYFFDANTGLIGTGVRWNPNLGGPTFPCAIFRTTDGGSSWTQCTVPLQMKGAVTQIYMQDASTGYASIMPASSGGPFSSLWKTTDGGITWTDPFQFDHALTCVYGSGNLIVATSWDHWDGVANEVDGGLYSTDGGASWNSGLTPAAGGNGANGVAFSDDLNGVVSEMNYSSGGGAHWYTKDGGQTWNQTVSTNQYESWSVYAVPNKHIFFTANEAQLDVPHQQVNWSTDGGATWTRRAYFPHMQFTGTIAGVDSTLYVQTDTATDQSTGADPSIVEGMYRSDDFGATWKFVGGPAHSRDTRFVVTGCSGEVVYAFDAFGNVWKTTDGGDGTLKAHGGSVTLNIPQQNFTMASAPANQPCGASTVAVPFFTSGCGSGARIDSAWLTGSSSFSIDDSRAFPRTFSSDSVPLRYDRSVLRSKSTSDTAFLHLNYTVNGQPTSAVIKVVGTSPATTAASFAVPRRAVAVGAYSQPVDLPLKEILPQFALDSLQQSGLATVSMTVSFDPSQLSYTFFGSPATLATTSIKHPSTGLLNVNYRNSGWSYSPGDFDLGTLRMTVQTRQPSEALIQLQSLSFVTQKGGTVYPCLTTVEDNQWQIEVQNMMSVSESAQPSSLRFAPSPFRDHIVVTNGQERNISMTLCDLLGREVATYNAASGQSQWNTSQLRPGIYVIYWQENGRLKSIKLTKTE